MRRHGAAILWLGLKELRGLLADPGLLAFLVYAFSFAVYEHARGFSQELRNAAVAIVDEDRSPLSRRYAQALRPPYFLPPVMVDAAAAGRRLDLGRSAFVLDIPPGFEADLLAGRRPVAQLEVDATVMMQAGIGAGAIRQILAAETADFLGAAADPPVALRLRVAFNPNLEARWFGGAMALVNNVTMLAVLLAGAAVIRERERGTLDHLLAMPVSPLDIALAKIWSNGLVITLATALSLQGVMRLLLGLPAAGSVPLFLAGVALYLFYATAIGLLLGTVARSMPQLGLLFILLVLPMIMLSGGSTPFESMPRPLQLAMTAFPSTHFVRFAQAILFRGAGFAAVWRDFAVTGAVGALVLAAALLRFRAAVTAA